jgi:hypothetical protein
MGCNTQPNVPNDSAVNVTELLEVAATQANGVIGIIDTCMAASAIPSMRELTDTRCCLLAAAAIGQPAYGLNMSRELTALLKAGLADSGPKLGVPEIGALLKQNVIGQTVIPLEFDGARLRGEGRLWLARNRRDASSSTVAKSPSPVAKVVERTHRLLHDWPEKLNTDHLRQALADAGIPSLARDALRSDEVLKRTLDHIVRWGAATERKRLITEFVVALAVQQEIDPAMLTEWVNDIQARVLFEDAWEKMRRAREMRRVRLIVNLRSLTGFWPEELEAYLSVDGDIRVSSQFSCGAADQRGAEAALVEAVNWAEAQDILEEFQDDIRWRLRHIDVAVPTKLLTSWHPDDVTLREGDYHVVIRWSQLLHKDQAREYRKRRRWISELQDEQLGLTVTWLDDERTGDRDSLYERLRGRRFGKAVGLDRRPGPDLVQLFLDHLLILLWPRDGQYPADQQNRVEMWRDRLPAQIIHEYHRLVSETEKDADPHLAGLRLVWADEDWLTFCGLFHQGSMP